MIHKLSDYETKWSLQYSASTINRLIGEDFILSDIKHDGHSFAKELRVLGIWANIATVDMKSGLTKFENKFYPFNDETDKNGKKFAISDVQVINCQPTKKPKSESVLKFLKTKSQEAMAFSSYFERNGANAIGFAISVKYVCNDLFYDEMNCKHRGISVEQIFLFSRYSNIPAHEPTGCLSAARCHPMVKYRLLDNTLHDPADSQFSKISSLRFDYRIHLCVDEIYGERSLNGKSGGNQAGLFADGDNRYDPVRAVKGLISFVSTLWSKFERDGPLGFPSEIVTAVNSGVSKGLFSAVEKPLALEIVAPGLIKGFPYFTISAGIETETVQCWDNLHWWGSKGPGGKLISAPGAFHCVHWHWRWGATAALQSGAASNVLFNPQTTRQDGLGSMWGPLVDPRIYSQTIRMAVIKNSNISYEADAKLMSLENWASLFLSKYDDKNAEKARPPSYLYDGYDIVLWLSITVYDSLQNNSAKNYNEKRVIDINHGTVFINGFYFAHDAEKISFKKGDSDPHHWPATLLEIRAAKQWTRPASIVKI